MIQAGTARPLRIALPFVGEGVRWRNALRWQPSGAHDFDWTPYSVPEDFRRETAEPAEIFRATIAALQLEGLSDWECARRLAGHLTEHAQDKGPIQSDLRLTYLAIRAGFGHCADYVKVYLALAHAAGLWVRQWAFTHNGFGGHGHTVVEIYDRARGKWLFLDVFNNFHACDPHTGQPLSALEFRDSVLARRAEAVICANGRGRPGFVFPAKLWEYYRRGAGEWYLVWGNAVFSAEKRPLVRAAMRTHPAVGHTAALLLGAQPPIRVLTTEQNAPAVERLARLGRRIRVTGFAAATLLIAAAVGVIAL